MPDSANPSQSTIREKVTKVIEQLRPAVQSHGGDLEFVDVDENGVVQVRLQGECVGCPSAAMTFKFGVERNLKERIPEVTEVICV